MFAYDENHLNRVHVFIDFSSIEDSRKIDVLVYLGDKDGNSVPKYNKDLCKDKNETLGQSGEGAHSSLLNVV